MISAFAGSSEVRKQFAKDMVEVLKRKSLARLLSLRCTRRNHGRSLRKVCRQVLKGKERVECVCESNPIQLLEP